MKRKLKEKVKGLPLSPGIYLMKDVSGRIIYIGKAKRLKQRVQSYFQKGKNHSPKIQKLVKLIHDFDYILTDTELEALLLECKKIKKWRPFFNTLMKNPQSYVYLTINTGKQLPEIEIIDEPSVCNDICFGPYTSKNTVKRAVETFKDLFRIQCSNGMQGNSPCLNYSLGRCLGMCNSEAARRQYVEIIDKFLALLSGTDTALLKEMQQNMENAAKCAQFEEAGKWRDCLQGVQTLIQKEKVVRFSEEMNSIVAFEYLDEATGKLFLIQRGKIIYKQKFDLTGLHIERLKEMIMEQLHSHLPHRSNEIVSRDEIDEIQIVYHYLKKNGIHYFLLANDNSFLKDEEWLEEKLRELFKKENSLKNRN